MGWTSLCSARSRRWFVIHAGAGLAGALVGCGDATSPEDGEGSDGADGGTVGSTSGADGSGSGGSTAPGDGDSAAESSTGMAGSSGPGESDGSSDETGALCEPSPSDIEGPFYRPGIPIGGDLDLHGDSGETLTLDGTVLGPDCEPIEGAVVEIWHATPVLPDGLPGDIDATYDDTAAYRYYGQVATDAQGSFEFQTLRPGWYLNGAEYRPAHIHLKVWVGGVERLTTQLYFVGDPFNDSDPWFNPDMALDPDGAGNVELEITV